MKVTVFGATGKIGTIVVTLLLEQGHEVCVFVHASPTYDTNDAVRVVKGDVHDASLVAQAVSGSQAVISCLGSWHTSTKDILSTAMEFIIPAMQKDDIARIISLTGSGAHAPSDSITFADKISHTVFSLVAGKIIRDAEAHLQLLSASNLNWTVLRAPVMRSGPAKTYKLNKQLPKAWETINRSAVAQAMVEQLEATNYYGQAPHVHQV